MFTNNRMGQVPRKIIDLPRKAAAVAALVMVLSVGMAMPAGAQKKMTYLFAERDTSKLFLDVYEPAEGSVTAIDGKEKPAVLFVFGGGFATGARDDKFYGRWFEKLTSEGYKVVSIDYRLRLKGLKLKPIRDRKLFKEAVDMAVEDVLSATKFIIDNSVELGIDPANIVTVGSSAGALAIISADYELCNRSPMTKDLPKDFRFKGVIPFSGALLRNDGKPKYQEKPAPTLFLHGKDDRIVPYKGYSFFGWSINGSDRLAKLFSKNGYDYWIVRYNDHAHEVSSILPEAWEYVSSFIEEEVMQGKHRCVDISVDDTSFKRWESVSTSAIYK